MFLEKNFYLDLSSGFIEITAAFILVTIFVFFISHYISKFVENRRISFPQLKSIFKSRKFFYFLLLLLFVLNLGLRLDDLGHPKRYFFDENFFAFTAQEMAKGNPQGWQKGKRAPGKAEFEWTHPPLGKEITAVGILIFGDKPSSWRIMQALFGAFGAIFIFLLAKNLFNSFTAGIFASFLYSFEAMLFAFSRIALVDIYLFNFILLASLFFVIFTKYRHYRYLFLTALFSGAAMSVKWTGSLVVVFLFSLSILVVFYKDYYEKKNSKLPWKSFIIIGAVFSVIPFLVYLASYIPYFLNGNSFGDFIKFQETMYEYHKNVSKLHVYRSPWWTWPLLLRPLCLYIEKIGKYREYIYAMGNPVIWWAGIAALIYSVYYSIKNKYYPLIFVVLSFMAYIVPWAISPRKITYIYHYIPSLLFVILALSFCLNKLWAVSIKYKIIVTYFLICVVAAFIFFHPVISGERMPKYELKSYRWMKSWI